MNTPTAEEFIKSTELVVKFDNTQGCILEEELPNLFIQFAKLHVEAALEAVNENVKLLVVNHEEHRELEEGEDLLDYYECGSDTIYVSSSSILNAYPLTNIV
jgi:hypothetical protein